MHYYKVRKRKSTTLKSLYSILSFLYCSIWNTHHLKVREKICTTGKVQVEIETFPQENMYTTLKGLYELHAACPRRIKNSSNQKFMF